LSIRLMSEVWLTKLPLTEKMVLLVIADHASDDGTEAWPSQVTIGNKASVSVRTVQRSVNSLVAKGFIHMAKGAGGSINCREDRRPHKYTINLAVLRGDAQTTRKQRVVSDDTDGATLTPTTGRLSRPMNLPNEPSKETPFDLFWKSYPLKVGKGAARKAWDKAIEEVDPDSIIVGALQYARDPNRHPSYTAHPSTWLNAGRWADDPLPAREISAEEKKAQEVESARLKSERERRANEAWFAEQEAQRAKAVPMPESFKSLIRKRIPN
jgi:DNA-binding transcriptional regulator YhcF (GntR family)